MITPHVLRCKQLLWMAMSQKLPVNGFKWKFDKFFVAKFDKDFIKNYDEDSNKGYTLHVDIEYTKKLVNLHSDLPFLPQRMIIKKSNKLVHNLYDKKDYVVHIITLQQALNHGPIFRNTH